MNAISALAPLVGNIELRHAVNPTADLPVGKHNFLLRPQGESSKTILIAPAIFCAAQKL